jgi:hypothetical protein
VRVESTSGHRDIRKASIHEILAQARGLYVHQCLFRPS